MAIRNKNTTQLKLQFEMISKEGIGRTSKSINESMKICTINLFCLASNWPQILVVLALRELSKAPWNLTKLDPKQEDRFALSLCYKLTIYVLS